MSEKTSSTCQLCASSEPIQPHTTPDGLTYNFCAGCGFISLNRRFHPTFEDAKERYLLHNNSLESVGYVEMLNDFISSCVSPFIGEADDQASNGSKDTGHARVPRILDFGSGPTPVLAELLKRRGVDIDIHDLHFATDTSYETRMYDAITATEVLEHLADPLETVQKLVTRLNPGGVLAVMTSFHPEDWEAFGQWRYRKDSTHISFFAKRTMEHLAAALGMDILFIDCKNLCVFGKSE